MLNRIILIGRLTQKPEMRYTEAGVPLSRFSIVVDRPPRQNGEGGTDLITVVVWRRLAEISATYLDKGRLIMVEGRVQVRSYETEGQRRWVTEVVGQKMKMLDKSQGTAATGVTPEAELTDIPFSAERAVSGADAGPDEGETGDADEFPIESEALDVEIRPNATVEDDIPF